MALVMTESIVGYNVYQIMPFNIKKTIVAKYISAMFCNLAFVGNQYCFSLYLL